LAQLSAFYYPVFFLAITKAIFPLEGNMTLGINSLYKEIARVTFEPKLSLCGSVMNSNICFLDAKDNLDQCS